MFLAADEAELAVLACACVAGAGERLVGVEDVLEDVLQALAEGFGMLGGKVIDNYPVNPERRVVVRTCCLYREEEDGLNG